MRRKRLQHIAHTLCSMFCGWRLVNCYSEMVGLGSGTLKIAVVTAGCTFNEQRIPELSIAKELEIWMKEDLTSHSIPLDGLTRVELVAELKFSTINSRSRSTKEQYFDKGEKPDIDAEWHRCAITCRSEVETPEKLYRGFREDLEEWPVGWPSVGGRFSEPIN